MCLQRDDGDAQLHQPEDEQGGALDLRARSVSVSLFLSVCLCVSVPVSVLSVCLSFCLSALASAAFEFMREHKEALDAAMKYERDFTYDFFAYKTLERSYLSKLAGHIVERPQVRLPLSLSPSLPPSLSVSV